MAIEFGGSFQYVITGSIDSGSAGQTFPWDTVLTIPNYKTYIVKALHATYNHAEANEKDTGLSVGVTSSDGLYYLCRENAVRPSSSYSVVSKPINLTPGQSLIAKSRGLHTVDLSVSYMIHSSSLTS